jgi:hypothetical protein
MARTVFTVTDVPRNAVANVPTQTPDQPNGNKFLNDGNVILTVKFAGGATLTVGVPSVKCSHGLLGDKSLVTAVAGFKILGPFDPELFNQSGADQGYCYVDFSTATGVEVAVRRIA